MSLLIVGATTVVTPLGKVARRGRQQGEIACFDHAVVRCDAGQIVFVGPREEHDHRFSPPDEILDAQGGSVIPGFVDPHTHIPFAGYREGEFDRRLQGESYASIAASGGGIVSTVAATRNASLAELTDLTLTRLDRQLAHGTTTTEAKSGYGLTTIDEIKQLQALADAGRRHPVEIVATAMPGHEVPPEWRHDPDGYVRLVINDIHPAIAKAQLAVGVDVFCEKGVFSLEQTRRLLADVHRYGWRIHLHADELFPLGGAELAAELGAASASHLLHVSDAGISALADKIVVAIVLPGVSFFLRDRFAPARKLVEGGVPVALATDCNPGSSHTESMPMVMALGCLGAGLTTEEALTAATLNAAAALGRADRIGSIETGKQADLVVLAAPSPKHLVYHFGVNLVRHVVKNGRLVIHDGHRV